MKLHGTDTPTAKDGPVRTFELKSPFVVCVDCTGPPANPDGRRRAGEILAIGTSDGLFSIFFAIFFFITNTFRQLYVYGHNNAVEVRAPMTLLRVTADLF